MKTITLKKISFVLLASLALASCSKDRDPIQDPSKDECADQKIVLLNTEFGDDPTSDITYSRYDLDNVSQGGGLNLHTYTVSEDIRFKLPPNNSIYDGNLHGIILNGNYYTYNFATQASQEHAIDENVVAPVALSNTHYAIELSAPYPAPGSTATFDIKEFNTQDGSTGSALPISAAEKSFTNNSLFHREIISSASNGTDKIYFLGGTNLITVNTANNTATQIDLYTDFSQDDWVTFHGIEYTEDFGLVAIKRDNDDFSLIKIDPQTGNQTQLVVIPNPVNTEFYSTAYNECNQTFYLTTLKQPDNNTYFYEIDLSNETIFNTQILPQYNYGLQIVKE